MPLHETERTYRVRKVKNVLGTKILGLEDNTRTYVGEVILVEKAPDWIKQAHRITIKKLDLGPDQP